VYANTRKKIPPEEKSPGGKIMYKSKKNNPYAFENAKPGESGRLLLCAAF
jgi:hypothetical protein